MWLRGFKTRIGDPEHLHTLSDAYITTIGDAGAVPLLIPSRRPRDEAGTLLDRIDGLLLSGGDDVDPFTYGHEDAGSIGADRAVDDWEIELVQRARRRLVPTLAICRGMQVLNVAHGGTLRQHIWAEGTPHPPLDGLTPDEVLAGGHAVGLTPSGRLAAIYGTTSLDVNSIHHQAIDDVGDGLEVEAVASDGVIEAVGSTDPSWWSVGVQWHPERTRFDVDKPLFAAFLDAATG